jgi:hypothetical protein
MLYPAAPDYSFKYQKIWVNAVMKEGRLIPAYFKKNNSYKCRCIDDIYGHPDPSCILCKGTGYNNSQEIENRKLVAVLSAPLDADIIQKYSVGNPTKSMRMLLISYPISPEFTNLYEIEPNIDLLDADGKTVTASVGLIVKPEETDAKIVFKEKLYNGNFWDVKELEFHIVKVESYIVSEYPIGQKLILQETNVESRTKRFLPKIEVD